MLVKWSTFSPYTLIIRVRIPPTTTVSSEQFVSGKTETKQKEVGVGPFLKTVLLISHLSMRY